MKKPSYTIYIHMQKPSYTRVWIVAGIIILGEFFFSYYMYGDLLRAWLSSMVTAITMLAIVMVSGYYMAKEKRKLLEEESELTRALSMVEPFFNYRSMTNTDFGTLENRLFDVKTRLVELE